jgi:hypothetical protein
VEAGAAILMVEKTDSCEAAAEIKGLKQIGTG